MAGIFGSIWSVLNGTGNFCGGMLGDYVGRKKLVGKITKLDQVYRADSRPLSCLAGDSGLHVDRPLHHDIFVLRNRQQSWQHCRSSFHLSHDHCVSYKPSCILSTADHPHSYATGVDCASLVYSSELYPGEYRAIGVSVSLSPVLFWGCIFTGAAGPAFASIGALYYVVFIALTSVMALVVIFFFPDVSLCYPSLQFEYH